MNGAVVLIDAGGAGGVTLANQRTIATNRDGYAVLPFATAYHRNDVALDSHSLPENVDLANSTVTRVPTKDAVVLARFHTHVGYKALFTLQSQGQPLPFGSEVRAKDTSSIVASEGQVYLAGPAPKGTLYAQWGGPSAALYCPLRSHPDAGADTPSTHFTADVNMSFLTLLRRATLTLLLALLPPPADGPVRRCLSAAATTLRLNVGQLTVPADARPGTRCITKFRTESP